MEKIKAFKKRTIREWNEEDRPREKLLNHGVEALTEAELLALLVHSGNKEMTAVELCQYMLSKSGNSLNNFARLSVEDLMLYKGIGEAKAITIIAALELTKRKERDVFINKQMNSPELIADYFKTFLQDTNHEEFWVLLLNTNLRIIKTKKIGEGGYNASIADIRKVLKEGLRCSACKMVVCHNHPSGNLQPSRQDDAITQRLYYACEIMNIPLLDHIIVAANFYYSYADEGRMQYKELSLFT